MSESKPGSEPIDAAEFVWTLRRVSSFLHELAAGEEFFSTDDELLAQTIELARIMLRCGLAALDGQKDEAERIHATGIALMDRWQWEKKEKPE